MEQIIIDFVTKASELVLLNRLSTPNTKDITPTDKPAHQFQLNFDNKFHFYNRIPPEWNAQTNKLLIIEFFLCLKATNTRFLVEQWIFDLSQISGKKLEDTIDSPQTLYKKLSVLLRTVSMLTVTLPLFRKSKESSRQPFTIEHSINFTRHTLSSWHPSVYDDKDLDNFTSPDFVLPGRAFTFKVNYSKTFKFLQNFQEELALPEDLYIKSPQNQAITHTNEDFRVKELSLGRRAWSDSYHNKEKRTSRLLTMYLNDSPSEGNPLQINGGDYENFFQAGTVPTSLQICAQISPREATSSPASRKSSGSKGLDASKVMAAQRLRVKTLESESLWDAEVYICENEEDKFTEVLSWKELSMRNKSPTRLSILQKERDEYSELQAIRKFSEDFEKSKRKLSNCSKPIEKIIEQTDDDRIAELIHSIEELKVLARTQSSRSSVNSGTTGTTAKTDRESSQGTGSEGKKGLRFETNSSSRKESGEELLNPFVELNELRELYLLMKRPGSAK